MSGTARVDIWVGLLTVIFTTTSSSQSLNDPTQILTLRLLSVYEEGRPQDPLIFHVPRERTCDRRFPSSCHAVDPKRSQLLCIVVRPIGQLAVNRNTRSL
jgi:hypothetical protein